MASCTNLLHYYYFASQKEGERILANQQLFINEAKSANEFPSQLVARLKRGVYGETRLVNWIGAARHLCTIISGWKTKNSLATPQAILRDKTD